MSTLLGGSGVQTLRLVGLALNVSALLGSGVQTMLPFSPGYAEEVVVPGENHLLEKRYCGDGEPSRCRSLLERQDMTGNDGILPRWTLLENENCQETNSTSL
jgi:hypothetical protein